MPKAHTYDADKSTVVEFVHETASLVVLLPHSQEILAHLQNFRVDNTSSHTIPSQGLLNRMFGGGANRIAEESGFEPIAVDRVAGLKPDHLPAPLVRKLLDQVGVQTVFDALLDAVDSGEHQLLAAMVDGYESVVSDVPTPAATEVSFAETPTPELLNTLQAIASELQRREQ